MKKYYCWAVGVGFLGAVSFCLLVPHATGQGTPGQTTDEDDSYKRAVEHYNLQAKESEDQLKRSDVLLAREEEVFKRQEEALKRYEKILETWERQQQEYQKYLDALPKK